MERSRWNNRSIVGERDNNTATTTIGRLRRRRSLTRSTKRRDTNVIFFLFWVTTTTTAGGWWNIAKEHRFRLADIASVVWNFECVFTFLDIDGVAAEAEENPDSNELALPDGVGVADVDRSEEGEQAQELDNDHFYNTPDAFPVIEYIAPNGLDKSVTEQDHSTFFRPDFLYNGVNQPARMVEFYAPWCPHCRHFRDHYVELAKQLQGLTQTLAPGTRIDVYAVSCTAHHTLCHDYGITGYPQLRFFPAGATNATEDPPKYFNIHPFYVFLELGIYVDELHRESNHTKPIHHHTSKTISYLTTKTAKKLRLRGPGSQIVPSFTAKDDRSTTEDEMRPMRSRTKRTIYNDAHLSFDFALRNGIFMGPGPLTNQTQDAFGDFLILLKRTMPPTWKIQQSIQALLNDFDTVIQGESQLLAVVNQYPPPVQHWSAACTHRQKGEGYTCGLWELFHIMTVGVVEYNRLVPTDSIDEIMIGTLHAATTIRNYVQHFFGCEVCRHHFVTAFDECKYDRCTKLNDEGMAVTNWMELPLWLWRTHNAVNVRLLQERARRNKQPAPTPEEEKAVQYPSRSICPSCWQRQQPNLIKDTDGGTGSAEADTEKIFMFLRIDYWPDDSTTDEMRTSLLFGDDKDDMNARKNGSNSGNSSTTESLPILALQLFPIGIMVGILVAWYTKRAAVRRSGFHKKIG